MKRNRWTPGKGWLVIGNYGTRNTGDDAMLLGLLYGLRERQPEVPIAVVAKSVELPVSMQGLGVQAVEPRAVSLWRAIRSANGIILGGGTHFHDDYSVARYFRHFRYMLRYLAVFLLARLLKKRVYLLGMGFGPFRFPITKILTRISLVLADSVSVRDSASYHRVAKWKSSNLVQTIDLAALLCREISHECVTSVKSESQKLRLGISVISIANIPGYDHCADTVFQSMVGDAIRTALDTYSDLNVSIFVFRGHWPREADVEVSETLKAALSDSSDRVELVLYCNDSLQTLQRIADCDFFIATRYHAMLLAYLAQRPLLCIAYHDKCRDLAETIGLPEEACLGIQDILQGMLVPRLTEFLAQPSSFLACLPVTEAALRAEKNLDILTIPHTTPSDSEKQETS